MVYANIGKLILLCLTSLIRECCHTLCSLTDTVVFFFTNSHCLYCRYFPFHQVFWVCDWVSGKNPVKHAKMYWSCLDESGSHRPELSEASVCLAPGGEYFVEGETWNIDSCTQCTCHSGRVLCETEVCPPLLCQSPVRSQDSCCPHCPGEISHNPCSSYVFHCRKLTGVYINVPLHVFWREEK